MKIEKLIMNTLKYVLFSIYVLIIDFCLCYPINDYSELCNDTGFYGDNYRGTNHCTTTISSIKYYPTSNNFGFN